MKESTPEAISGNEEEKIDLQEIFYKYLYYWPWIIGSIVLCLGVAWAYLRYATPIYNAKASVMIKDEKRGGNSAMVSDLENIGLSGMFASSQNIDNEIEMLSSEELIKQVVHKLALYTTYTDEDQSPSRELYGISPVLVDLPSYEVEKLTAPVALDITMTPGRGLRVEFEHQGQTYAKELLQLPAVWVTPVGTLRFSYNRTDSLPVAIDFSQERHLTATISPSLDVAKCYFANLSIEPKSKTSSVIMVSLKNSNLYRAKAFIHTLLEAYNNDANDYKNEVVKKTGEFIDGRLSIIDKELGSTEEALATFKRSAGLTDLSSDAQQAVTGNAEYEKKRVENGTQINLVSGLMTYVDDSSRGFEVLPNNVGIADQVLTGQIGRYNELIIERKRLIRTSTENNPTILNLDASIRAMRANIKATTEATLRGLHIVKSGLDKEASRFNQRINDAPGYERRLVNISRKQEIKAGLYLMLLQKREENAIALAATTNNAKIIGDVVTNKSPISPKANLIYLVALCFGLGLPVGIIYLLSLLKVDIETDADIEKLTHCPIIGDVPFWSDKNAPNPAIGVYENQNNVMSEAFRNLRTNVQFMLPQGSKVILVTSTISGEGKSFVSSNLAVSLSLLGKRVVIVGLDVRKPMLHNVFGFTRDNKGITSYLVAPTKDLLSYVHRSELHPNISIIPAGIIPPNPTELLARESLEQAIEELKKHYDYIVLDTAPVGLVTDTKLVGRVADLSIYVCRSGYTRKKEYTLINKAAEVLPNLCTLLNSVDLDRNRYYYSSNYKYGYYYGYNYRADDTDGTHKRHHHEIDKRLNNLKKKLKR